VKDTVCNKSVPIGYHPVCVVRKEVLREGRKRCGEGAKGREA
jgi:hypothetical protein